MNRRPLIAAAFMFLAAIPAIANDYIVPVFALRVPGANNALWTSEVYVTNPGSAEVRVYEGGYLLGRMDRPVPCLPVAVPSVAVKPGDSVLFSALSLTLGLGCPRFAVVGLMFHADASAVISSRMVSTSGDDDPSIMLHGLGQEIPAFDIAELPPAGTRMILPAVAWQPNACGPPQFGTNLFFANPGGTDVSVLLDAGSGTGKSLVIDGTEVALPFTFTVSAQTMRQFSVSAPDTPLTVCQEPAVGSLTFIADGPVASIASVVDRSSGDPRTVLPIPAGK